MKYLAPKNAHDKYKIRTAQKAHMSYKMKHLSECVKPYIVTAILNWSERSCKQSGCLVTVDTMSSSTMFTLLFALSV